jgi:hypothetical protein
MTSYHHTGFNFQSLVISEMASQYQDMVKKHEALVKTSSESS